MFVCIDPCTWQGREYDNHSTPLERINPEKLNTDQWCETAQLWGAKEILFVAKHTGGFCWWQTETTDYGIKNTPYKNGKGDVLKELAESCKKYGLNLGIYVYPGDETWGAGIGSGGRTKNPAKQKAYNKVFRTQLKETLTKYGDIIEVWFDGSCAIDVSDILEKYAKNAVIFQGAHATIRWSGTESGKLFYPYWNTVKSEDLKTGVATQVNDDPNGDAWAPIETNTTLYDHYWFWSPEKEKKRKSLDELMECYYKSIGYGSVFLLNSSPDTNGLIPEADRKLYKAFGDEINRRFKTPIASFEEKKGKIVTLDLSGKKKINHVVTMEDYRLGHRIREYEIEGLADGNWKVLCRGQSVGRMKIDYFDEVEVSKIRLNVTRSVNEPVIRKLSAYYVEDFVAPPEHAIRPWSEWKNIAVFDTKEDGSLEINLTGKIKMPGQFIVKVEPEKADIKFKISNVELIYDGQVALKNFVTVKGNEININRTAQVTGESRISLRFMLKSVTEFRGKILFKPALIY
ncbi:MAG: alpha-L-fucosidase [Deltaproteobacteria bacterium]|nr:alpha-L-fucosidase [Deltaproteobacteria bacterium]